MLKVGVGISKHKESDYAAREAGSAAMKQAGIKKADLILVFATSHYHHDYLLILNVLHDLATPKQLCGCSAYGVLTEKEEVEQGPSIVVLALSSKSIVVDTFLIQNIFNRQTEAGAEVSRLLASDSRVSPLMLLFPDTFNFQFDHFYQGFLNAIQSSNDPIPEMIGGGASEDGSSNETFQFHGRGVTSNAIAGLLISGNFQYEAGVTHACHPIGTPLMVTKSKGNVVYEICGKPATQSFTELFKDKLHHQEELEDAASLILVGLGFNPCNTSLQNKEYVVRNILSLNPEEGTLTVSGHIEEGKVISYMVRDPKRAYQEAEEMVTALASKFPDNVPKFGIYINCCGRGNSLYGKKNVDTALIRKHFGNMPLIGFFSYAEIAPTSCGPQWHNYSGVLVVFSETRLVEY
ncbi:MAG: FIST C-terminal domain-containing protein [Nitrospirae bacterium]|nr:FIST C-terminal domain-containing protein [Nitrospirota bacterium]MBI3594703.1 FIST C-terminal domain-containing protein [Nitrospirota bacterium]